MMFRRLAAIVAVLMATAVLGLSLAWAASTVSTGTNVSCATATATLPDHTVGVDGAAVDTITGTSTTASQCETQTYTIPTSTVTTTVTPSPTISTTSTSSSTTTAATTSASTTIAPSGAGTITFDGTFSSTDPQWSTSTGNTVLPGPHYHNRYGDCDTYVSPDELKIDPQPSCSPISHYRTDICTAADCSATATSGEVYDKGTAYCTSIPFDVLKQVLDSSGNAWYQVAEMKDNKSSYADWGIGIAHAGSSYGYISFGAYNSSSAMWTGPGPVPVGWHTISLCQSADGNTATAFFDGKQITWNHGPCAGQTSCSTDVNLYGNAGQSTQPLDINAYTGNTSGADPYGGIPIIHGDPLIATQGTNGLPPEPSGGWNSP